MNAPQAGGEPRAPITLGAAARATPDDVTDEEVRREQARIQEARRRAARQDYEARAAQGDQYAATVRKRLGRMRLRNGAVGTTVAGVLLAFVFAQASASGQLASPLLVAVVILAVVLVVCLWTMSPSPKAEQEVMRYQRERKQGKR